MYSTNLNKNNISSLWSELNWEPSKLQLEQMITLQTLLREWNKKLNLTKLTEGDEYWISQVFDSLWPLKREIKNSKQTLKCIDMGTGCGFPGIAAAIALPNARFTLVDSIKKKTAALKSITEELGLQTRINIKTDRAEKIGHNQHFRGSFNLAMSRAVGKPSVVAEYLVPLIESNGEVIIFLGHWNKSNEKSLIESLKFLNARISKVEHIELPNNKGIRHQVRVKSALPCPIIYPRASGIPKKNPL